ncbi:MAG TPA: lactonase family protein [Chryseolinea sp.]|nr:lactonase family protein [Chryseolinea sp.]
MKLAFFTLFIALSAYNADAQSKKEILYAGTYSVRGSEGIYVYQFDRAKRTLKKIQTVPSLESPTYLTLSPSGKFLYAVNRGKANISDNGGSVSAYAIDRKTGFLSGLNHRSSYGDMPCYISLDRSGKFAFICNYAKGNLVVLPIFEDGLLGIPADAKKYSGSSINSTRQEEPHVHSATFSADNRFVYVCDLGTDKIYVYEFSADSGKLTPTPLSEVNVNPGSGPRHLTFHPNGNYAYLAEELTSSVCVFQVNKMTGDLTVMQDTVRALPSDYSGPNASADIHTDIKGNFLYMSNRGHNSISIFSIAPDGRVVLVGQQLVDGKTPRNFLIESKGEFMFVANQDTDTIITYKINPKTGALTAVGKPVAIPSPACLKMSTLP